MGECGRSHGEKSVGTRSGRRSGRRGRAGHLVAELPKAGHGGNLEVVLADRGHRPVAAFEQDVAVAGVADLRAVDLGPRDGHAVAVRHPDPRQRDFDAVDAAHGADDLAVADGAQLGRLAATGTVVVGTAHVLHLFSVFARFVSRAVGTNGA